MVASSKLQRATGLSVPSMEALYQSLQDEIQIFEEHIRHCQQAFDIHTFVSVLQLSFPKDGGTEDVRSIEQLQKLFESREWGGQVIVTTAHETCDTASYISWFVSYVKYLSSLKETFDDKVVFPMCENLYVNDDVLDALPLGHRGGPHATASVARTAKQLFALRRKWALLLKSKVIEEQAFSPQSLIDLPGVANIHPFVKVIRLVPDLFHKSLAAAALARQWLELHARQHSSQPAHLNPSSAGKGSRMALLSSKQQGYSVPVWTPELPTSQPDSKEIWYQAKGRSSNEGNTCKRIARQERNNLQEIHEELMSLLWREQRSWTLEAELQELQGRYQELAKLFQDRQEICQDLQPASGLA